MMIALVKIEKRVKPLPYEGLKVCYQGKFQFNLFLCLGFFSLSSFS